MEPQETQQLLSNAVSYLVRSGGSYMAYATNLAAGQRLGQAFFNSLSSVDQERLRGSIRDPFFASTPEQLRKSVNWLLDTEEPNMSDENQNEEQNLPAADPAEEHKTPGGNPVQQNDPSLEVETTVETPGGTTVTESPSE